MPIIKTFGCPECNHVMDVTLDASQWDDPPPDCPRCAAFDSQNQTQQVFKPVAIGGSVRSKAVALAEDIASKDYNVANFTAAGKEGHAAKVTYKDTRQSGVGSSAWVGPNSRDYQVTQEVLQSAVNLGRASRMKYGSGLDILQHTLKTGDQPDLIELSKKRSHRIW